MSRYCAASSCLSRRTALSSVAASMPSRMGNRRHSSMVCRNDYSELGYVHPQLTLSDAKENPVKMTQPKRGRGSRRTTVTRGTTSAPTRVVSARPATSTTAPRAPTSASGSAARAAAIRAALQNADLPEEPRREAPPVARTTRATAVASSATAAPSSGSYANPTVISDDEDEFGDLDDSFIQAIDEAEVVAAAASRSRTQSQTPAPPRTQQRSSGRTVIPADAEVIELIDSD